MDIYSRYLFEKEAFERRERAELSTDDVCEIMERGPEFVNHYKALLASTGEASAAGLAARFGNDIRRRAFWEGSLAIIGRRIDRYCKL